MVSGSANRQRLLLLLFLLMFSCVSFGREPRNLLQQLGTAQWVQQVIRSPRQWVPYPVYTDRSGWDKFLGSEKPAMIRGGEKLLDYRWEVIKATDYLEYSRSGSRNIMQVPYSRNLKAITALFMAEMAEGKGRFTDQLINGVFAACEMTTWSLSAHLSLQQGPKKFPDHQQNIIDLVSGDVGALFSWIYYFLHVEFDKRDSLIAQRLRYELERRILQPYLERNDFWWSGFNGKPDQLINNWNPWCNSNVLQAFALMEKDPKLLAKAVYRSMVSVDHFINYVKADGACEEGPSYWGHAAGKLYDYLQLLYDISGGKISIFDQPMIRKMGEYIARSYVGNGWVVNFADASARGGGDAGLIYRYGKAVHSNEMQAFAAYLALRQPKTLQPEAGRDLYRLLQGIAFNKEIAAITPGLPAAAYTWYPQTEFCYMRSGRYFFAAKGGFNNESHNHNDVGSFSLYVDTLPFFVDAGVGTYTRQTFSNERYQIWTMQSNYHNLPLINGVAQSNGARYKADKVHFDAGRQLFSMDIAGAYKPEAAVKQWQRSYQLTKGGLRIEDRYELSKWEAPTVVNFLTWARPDISDPGTIIWKKEPTLVCLKYDQALFTPAVETVPLDDPRLSHVWGPQLYRLSLTLKESRLKGSFRFEIATLSSP
ncbi:heparinase II/III-family protein [Niabella terrae]